MFLEAQPILKAATAALEKVEMKKIEFMKSLASPAAMIITVCKCIAYFKPNGNDQPEGGWPASKQMLNKPEEFLGRL